LLLRGLNVAHERRAALKGEEIRKAKQSFQVSLIMIVILMLMVLEK
jgi:hypothetical protein